MNRLRLLLLGAAVPFVMIPAAGPASAQDGSNPIVLAQAEDGQAQLSEAEAEVAAARQALEEARETDGDVAAAEERLETALDALADAEAEVQAADEAEPEIEEAEPEIEEDEPEVEEPEVEGPEVEKPEVAEPEVAEPEAEEPEVEEPEVEEPEVEEPEVEEPEVEEPDTEERDTEERDTEERDTEELETEEMETEELDAERLDTEEPDADEPEASRTRERTTDGERTGDRERTRDGERTGERERTTDGERTGERERTRDGERTGERERTRDGERTEDREADAEEPADAEAEVDESAEAEAEAETEAAVEDEAEDDTAVEQQLEAQGDEEEVENIRELRRQLRRERQAVEETQDEEAEAEAVAEDEDLPEAERAERAERRQERAERREERRRSGERRRRDAPPEGEIVEDFGARFIVRLGDTYVIRQDETAETDRLLYRAQDVNVENIGRGRTRTTITRMDGTQIITDRDRYGDIIWRTRVTPRGREIVLIDNRDFYREGRRRDFVVFEEQLPPLRIEIAREDYIVETQQADRGRIRQTLMAPPVEQVERVYALEEVRTSERLRDKLRRVDLDTINFEFGSAAIPPSQFDAVEEIGFVLEDILDENPDEIFLIEGHTDAVGSDSANLVLSDRRAEAVATMLSSNFDIPPENLVPQGYGEEFLKVQTQAPERENRRVAIRRITELVRAGN